MRDYFGERLGAERALFSEFSFRSSVGLTVIREYTRARQHSSGSITSGATCRGTKLVPLQAYFNYTTLDNSALAQIV